MSRRLLCKECGKKYQASGTIELLPRSSIGEPAEIGRIIKGKAKTPQQSQRIIYMNDIPMQLEQGNYDCDLCGSKIAPGDECTCISIWLEGKQPIPIWEDKFIEV